ncbi:MAG TPA: glycosyltransferase family 4 protein [Thermoanaerobaculia bacterium]|nr:glycosyltransferase family 4 protein [Thermoanaerobaculia bacterium]
MLVHRRHRALYAAFDRFPTRKGASTHIARFAPCLFEEHGGGLLYVVGDETLQAHQIEGDVEIVRFSTPFPNLLERAVAFGEYLACILEEAGDDLEICHFRDPWSGVPILERPHRYSTVFEVNALPSIELPYAYPSIAPRTLDKIRAAERFCLETVDRIVTPSRTTRDLLVGEGVPASKIDVVPNGADPVPPLPRPFEAPDEYLIYFGALQPWQGIDTLLHAFARLADLDSLRLVVCGSGRSRHARAAEKLAGKLGLGEKVIWRWELPSSELEPWLGNALLSIAPLRACSRNVEQGCAPLKILESLAAGVPVVASDLPPVREIVTDGVEGRLVAPDRPAELARAIRVLLHFPRIRAAMAVAARERAAQDFTWDRSLSLLKGVYRSLRPPAAKHFFTIPTAEDEHVQGSQGVSVALA